MIEFDIKRSSRFCARTEKEMKPGDVFFSVLIDNDEETRRVDVLEEAWEGPPENCIGWWRCQIPEVGAGRIYWAPNNVLRAYFEQLVEQPAKAELCFVVALLLVRKRLMKLEDTADPQENVLNLYSAHLKKSYTIPVAEITPARVAAIQDEISEQLFTDQSPDLEQDPDNEEENQQPAD